MKTDYIIDISPALSASTPVWPGDEPLRQNLTSTLKEGSSVNLSCLNTTVHLGAHADAPWHFKDHTPTIGEVELEPYLGPCVVKTIAVPKEQWPYQITVSDCQSFFTSNRPERILFRTGYDHQQQTFQQDFVSFSLEAMNYLGEQGVKLVGIDTPSVDSFDSKSLAAHHAMLQHGIRNLEGLELQHVRDGAYELIALPLKLMGFDASPVRAVLRKLSSDS